MKPYPVDISTYQIKKINGFDFEFGFIIKNKEVNVPKNMLSLQEKEINFYYLNDTDKGIKRPYILKKGDVGYFIGTDNFLYFINDDNKLVIGEFRGEQVKWVVNC